MEENDHFCYDDETVISIDAEVKLDIEDDFALPEPQKLWKVLPIVEPMIVSVLPFYETSKFYSENIIFSLLFSSQEKLLIDGQNHPIHLFHPSSLKLSLSHQVHVKYVLCQEN